MEKAKSVSDMLNDMGVHDFPFATIEISVARLKLTEAKEAKNEYAYYFWHRLIKRLEDNKTPIGEEQSGE